MESSHSIQETQGILFGIHRGVYIYTGKTPTYSRKYIQLAEAIELQEIILMPLNDYNRY